MAKLKYFVKENEFMNNETFIQIYDMLKSYHLNLFEYKNLPETIPEFYIEQCLFEKGRICFFKDYKLDILLALPVNTVAPFNVYGEATRYQIISDYNSYRRFRRPSTAVIMYNNRLRKNSASMCQLYAMRVAESQRTADVNLNAQKTPIILLTDDDQLLAMENLFNEYRGNAPLIIGNKNLLSSESLKSIDLKCEFKGEQIMTYKRELLNEYFTFIGINNANVDKKERMITGEVESNNDQVEHARINMLRARVEAVDKINKMFGTNITVKFSETKADKIAMANNFVNIKNKNAEGEKFKAEAINNLQNEPTKHKVKTVDEQEQEEGEEN